MRKIRLFPSPDEADTLRRWVGTARWTYNACLAAVNNGTPRTLSALRAACLNADSLSVLAHPWVANTPYDVRDEALRDLLKAYDSNFAAKRARFTMRFRSKKADAESIVVHSKHWAHKRGAYAFLSHMRAAEPLPVALGYDARLVRERYGRYYLCVPLPAAALAGENQAREPHIKVEDASSVERRVVALDPGVRTFLTAYSPSGDAHEIGKGDVSRLYRLAHTADALQSRWTHIRNGTAAIFPVSKHFAHWSRADYRHRLVYRMKRAAARIRRRVRNLVDELHRQSARWLAREHDVVLLPTFDTSRMVRRSPARRLNSKSARGMVTWSHYRFRQHLLHKARELDCNVVLCSEAYTSKTCGACGRLNASLGGSKVFKCPSCGATADRDVHAARNILLRYMSTGPLASYVEA